MNLEIVGTSHISPESKKRIICAFNNFKPDIVCVELDKQRFLALKDKGRKSVGLSAIRDVGVTGFLFALIGGFIQKKLGNLTGMMPGEEMLLGVSLAKKGNLRVELIDQDVRVTLRKINRIPFRERVRIVWDIVRSPFQRKNRVKVNLASIPDADFVRVLTSQLKSRYPYIYKVVIDERDKLMAKRLFVLLRENPGKRVLAIVGEGHVDGMFSYLKKLDQDNVSFISYKF